MLARRRLAEYALPLGPAGEPRLATGADGIATAIGMACMMAWRRPTSLKAHAPDQGVRDIR
jgi:hypothetical protein